MPDVAVQNSEALTPKKFDKKTVGIFLGITVVVVMLAFIIITSLTSKKHTMTNQQISQQNSSENTPQTQAVQPLPHINTVTLTKSGFSPAKTAIQKGTAVKWINDSGTDNASVNSDDYPTNQKWPELNLGKVANGSSVAHIFTTAGTYTYHNEFNPKETGTIVVE